MIRLSPQRLLLCVFVGVVFTAAAVASARPQNLDTDLWWHLANGRYILQHGVPATEIYSYTAAGQVWVVHEWLADVLMYSAFQLGGLSLLVLLGAAAVAAALVLVYRLLRRGGLGVTTAVALAMALAVASAPSWGFRPQVLNFLLSAALVTTLFAYRARPSRAIYALAVGFLLWANLHSGYVVGLGLLAVFTVAEALPLASERIAGLRDDAVARLSGREVRRLAIVLLAGVLCGFATPAGWRTVVFALGTLTSSYIQSFIAEWSSPDFHAVQGYALMVPVLVLVGGLAARRRGRGVDLDALLLGMATLVLALTSQRHVPIFAAGGAVLLGRTASDLLAALGFEPRRAPRPAMVMAMINLAILAGLAGLAGSYTWDFVSPAALERAQRQHYPVDATRFLLKNNLPTELYNAYEFGGYLDWAAYPRYRVFIDGRIEVFGKSVFDEYLRTERIGEDWATSLDARGVRTVMVAPGDLLRFRLEASGWRLAYQDAVAVIYTRG